MPRRSNSLDRDKKGSDTSGFSPLSNPTLPLIGEGEYVYRLGGPHVIGSICGNPCEQCQPGEGKTLVMSVPGKRESIEPIPLYIVRAATFEEWLADIRNNGGNPDTLAHALCRHENFYVVRPD